jgi:hypothetical protein
VNRTTGFHQLLIDDVTSKLLSVLSEGVPQGSGLLQEFIMDIFGEYEKWTIVIFDNLLILVHDYKDSGHLGHGLLMAQVAAFRESCPICQKTEDYMSSQLVPIKRHLMTNPGKVVGIDYLTVVKDRFGNAGAYVLRDHFSKLIFLFSIPSHDSLGIHGSGYI